MTSVESTGQTGRLGEDAACRTLELQGHQIIARNWRTGHLEVDIISRSLDGLHFVEVKTRRPPVNAMPEENVRAGKQRRIARAANSFLHSRDNPCPAEVECHFDIVSVILKDTMPISVRYFPDAWWPIFV